MELCYNIPIRAIRQPDLPGDVPIRLGLPGPRLIPPPHRAGRVHRALAASTLLHASALALILLIVRVVVPAAPPEAPTVALAFEQAPVPAPAPPQPVPPQPVPPQPVPPQPAPPPQPASPPEPKPPPPPPKPQQPPPPVQQPPPPVPQPPPPAAAQPPPPEVTPEQLPLPPPPAPSVPRQRPLPVRPRVEEPATPSPQPPARSPAPIASSPAPQAAAPAPAPAPAETPSPQISESWRQALAAWLASHKIYPEEARRRDEQGNVTLRFTVEPSGRVVNVAVVHGSGSPRLDAAAEAMLHNATLPPFDTAMPQVPVTATVQIRYALED
jgi:protein TonB